MDCNGKQPLLSGLIHHMPKTIRKESKDAPNRRRYRRCKSAPTADFIPSETVDTGSLPRYKSIFGNIHPSFIKVSILFFVYLGVGTLCFYLVRHQIKGNKTDGILDAIYFCIVTMTTLGYGDLVPNSNLSKLLACAFVFSGMALFGMVLSKGADYLVEKQEILLVKALHGNKKAGHNDILKEVEINRTRYKCVVTFVLLLLLISAGTIFLAYIEKLDLVDAFYCVCATITTLGYGDKSFSTKAGRVFAIFWILISSICLAQFLLYIAELNTEARQKSLVKWVLTRRTTNVDLEVADLDNDGIVSAAEFILFKLKEMGKITQEDVSLVMEEFEDLDVDHSGTLDERKLAGINRFFINLSLTNGITLRQWLLGKITGSCF